MSVQPGTPTINTKWRVDVNTGTSASPTWVQVKGMSAFTPTIDKTTQDATDYDAVGWGSDAVTLRKLNGSGTVMRKRYADAYDPGQQALQDASETLAVLHVRYWERDVTGAPLTGGKAKQAFALVNWEDQGGDPAGLSTANFTLMGQGEVTDADLSDIVGGGTPPPAWQATTAYSVGDDVTLSGGEVLNCTVSGTSGSTEPVAPGVGLTVDDGTVTWEQTA